MTSVSRTEWVEIIEPRTREHMYANLTTGECVWDPPEGVNIKRTDESQWWELFDKNTKRFYYYNVATQTTAWHRPTNCDIIPLAKLQTLKQNTDPNDSRDECGPSTSKSTPFQPHLDDFDFSRHSSPGSNSSRGKEARCADILGGLSDRHSSYSSSRMSTLDQSPGSKNKSHRYCRHTQGSSSSQNSKHNFDFPESSDSSLSSGAHGYSRAYESGSLRLDSQHRSKHSDNSYRKLQESSSSHNIPHISLPSSESKKSPQLLPYSTSNTLDLCNPSSSSTPQFKKKMFTEAALTSSSSTGKRESPGGVSKHKSFDYASNTSSPTVSLVRSGSFMSSPRPNPIKKNIDGLTCGGSDDSMHEKYFKSVENTPVSKRRNQSLTCSPSQQKHSSDSSPHSPLSPKKNTLKLARPTALATNSAAIESIHQLKSSQMNDEMEANKATIEKPERYLDKMKQDMPNKISPINDPVECSSPKISIQQINNIIRPSSSTSTNKSTKSSQFESDTAVSGASSKEKSALNAQNLERHSKKHELKPDTKFHSYKNKKRQQSAGGSDVEYDNGDISPLYSNWDQETQEHLLPLQHYIMEQAQLSGNYLFGDPLDSDSFHSDTQSEHSLSGHEPDNEDSDHSNDRGDYLAHHYSGMDDYGEFYYNVDFGLDRLPKEDNLSEEVEAKLENEVGQIYSPVRDHPFFQLQQRQLQKQKEEQQQQQQIEQQQREQQHREQRESKPKYQQQQEQLKQQQQQSPDSIHPKQHPPKPPRKQPSVPRPPPSSLMIHNTQPDTTPNTSNAPTIRLPQQMPTVMKECDIEKFAQDNLNLHSKGIFRKKSSLRDMLSWTDQPLNRPMLALSVNKVGKKIATEMFKLVQIYMGDRKARDGMSLNSVAIDIISSGLTQVQLRDELYIQLCRQTTENHKRESLIRGWELLAICLSFLPPSPTFQPALLNYMNRHRDLSFAASFPEVGKWPIHVQVSHYASVACRRLDRIGSGGKKQAKKPTDDEVNQSRDQIFRNSMFGNTLEEVMDLQKDKFPHKPLPWIQVTLSEQVLLLNGKQTEGIFRVSADVDEVSFWKARLDRWEVPEHKVTMDAHAPASLLKLWYRELYDPLIPDALYEECVNTEDAKEVTQIINKIPPLNKLVLTYLVYFLQQFANPDVVSNTKMDSSNLAMVFAPNILRCTSHDPKVILENARKEMAFMRTLIASTDTSSVSSFT